jgi:hypothetical protein
MGPEFTFKPDTTVSKYYYQRLENRDPAYQQRRQLRGESHPSTSHLGEQSPSEGGNGIQRSKAPTHRRNLSESLSRKEKL